MGSFVPSKTNVRSWKLDGSGCFTCKSYSSFFCNRRASFHFSYCLALAICWVIGLECNRIIFLALERR